MFRILETKDLRNEAAHGKDLLDINRAKKAQDVSFIHEPSPDVVCQIGLADNCHKLIIEILELFK